MLFIFDMGGVIASAVDVVPQTAKKLGISREEFFRLAAACGNEKSPVPQVSAKFIGKNPYVRGGLADLQGGFMTSEEFWKNFEQEAGIKAEFDFWRFYFQPKLITEMYNLVCDLRKKYRVVCGTNTIDCHYQVHMERGDYSCFDKVYASHFMHIIKPDPAFWKLILDAENESAENAVFIDDNADNIEAAESLGIRSHFFTTPKDTIEFVKNLTK